jgi:A nuclease of the HNH/ENDO VII superfamily with conserved WHH/DNase/tRNase domain of colicin-like bacteriocin/Pre-toxin TG
VWHLIYRHFRHTFQSIYRGIRPKSLFPALALLVTLITFAIYANESFASSNHEMAPTNVIIASNELYESPDDLYNNPDQLYEAPDDLYKNNNPDELYKKPDNLYNHSDNLWSKKINFNHSTLDQPHDDNSTPKKDKNLLQRIGDYVANTWDNAKTGWDGPKKAWDRTVEDWNKMWDDPGKYWSEVFGWEDIKNSWNRMTSDPKKFFSDAWSRTKKELKGIKEDPLGTVKQIADDIIGVNDLKAFWNGVDPESGEKLSIPDRIVRGVAGLPIPHTKLVKLVDKGLKIGKKIFIKPACTKSKSVSCPTGNNNNNNNKKQPKDRTPPPKNHPKMGKVEVDPNTGKRYFYDINGKKQPLRGGQYAGQTVKKNINGRTVNVTYDKNGFPDFTPFTDFESKLPRDDWFKSDKTQFGKLNREVYDKMKNDPALQKKIDDKFMSVLEHGNGRGNGAKKVKSFLNGNDELKKKLTQEDINRLESGEGLTPATLNKINSDPNLKEEFLKANRDWTGKGEDPVGYVWNHHQDPGRMQLTDHKVHTATLHTGGRSIWGGGNKMR